jgi:hypothetical protein
MRKVYNRHGVEVWEHGYGTRQRFYQVYDHTKRLDVTNSMPDAIITAWWHAELAMLPAEVRATVEASGMHDYVFGCYPDWSDEDIVHHDADFVLIRATLAQQTGRSAA